MKRYKSCTILNFLLFSIAIMLSCHAFAADTTPRRVTQHEFDAAMATVNSKISDITPPVRAIGDILPDNSIVFWVDETGQHGLAVWSEDDAHINWYVANELAENHGPGWRLPTKYELNLLYIQRDVVGVFGSGDYYWSSTEAEGGVWVLYPSYGKFYTFGKSSGIWSARAVRAF